MTLAERWVAAWTYARGLEVEMVDGWPLVRVGLASRESELVCWDPGPRAFAKLLSHIDGDPRAMLTVIAADLTPYTSLVLPPGIRVDRDDETLMSVTLTPPDLTPHDPEFCTRWIVGDSIISLALETDSRVAVEGTVGILGTDAVFDAIETTPAYQRRGLGRWIMAMLTSCALDHGATHGVLAATTSGRGLYEALGWEPSFPMWSLMGVSEQHDQRRT